MNICWAAWNQPIKNPSKCCNMSVYRSRSPVLKDYKLFIKPNSFICSSTNLPWNSVIWCFMVEFACMNKTVKKADSTLCLSNVMSTSVPRKLSDLSACVTLVRPRLQSASAVYDPYRPYQIVKCWRSPEMSSKIYKMRLPVRNLQRCTAPQNSFKIAVQLNYSCLAAF